MYHDIDESGKLICKEDKKSCVLCSQEHSAAYANCPAKIDKLKEIKNKINKNFYANKLINNNNKTWIMDHSPIETRIRPLIIICLA